MIDLHSHLLPGVDDGSRTVEQSVRVLDAMARLGITDICLTPHLPASRAEAGPPPAHQRAFEVLQPHAPTIPRLHRGAEVMLDRPISRAVMQARNVTLAGSRYLLVEFPRLVAYDTVCKALSQVADTGIVPLLAHPERYSCCSVPAVRYWRSLGAKMQVDATTLLASQARGQRARALLSEGLADVLAGDNHGDDRTIATGARFLSAQDGEEQAQLLVTANPAAILRDGPLAEVPPLQLRQSWMRRIRQFLQGNR